MGLSREQKTFLDLISYCEGTIGRSQNGYDLLFGGKKVMKGWDENTNTIRHRYITDFGNYVAKPDLKIQDPTWKGTTSNGATTTAAGRYQFLGWVWASETKKILNDENAFMTKENQNNVAWKLAERRGLTNEIVKNGLNSKSDFETTVKTLCRENNPKDVCIWEAFHRIFIKKSYGITIDQAFQFFKGAYDKYGSGDGSQSNFSSGTIKTTYLNQNGESIPKFGTSTISSNGDTNKFYVNVPPNSSGKIVYFWAGLESVISREEQWSQIPDYLKQTHYIIMAAGTTSSNQNSKDDMKSVIKKFNNSIQIDSLSEFLMGYSAGGYSVFNNYENSYSFIGLMDPSLASTTNTEDRTYGGNVSMIWGSSGMKSISNWSVRYPKVQESIKNGGGFSQEINNLDHGIAITKWFEIYGDKVKDINIPNNQDTTTNLDSEESCITPTGFNNNGGNTTTTTTSNNSSQPIDEDGNIKSNCNSNPNASYLRQVLSTLGYQEKIYVNGSKKYIVPSLDTSTGCYKLKTSKGFDDGEMSNGGDLNKNLAITSAAIFSKIKEIYPSYKPIVTGGNDSYHQKLSYNSRHKTGKGIDFVISGAKRSCTSDPKWGETSTKGDPTDVKAKYGNVIEIIRGFSGGLFDNLRYIDEVCNKTSAATGDHIHFSWGAGSEGQSRADLAKAETDAGTLSTYSSQDLFS